MTTTLAESPELPLSAPPSILEQLAALLPPGVVHVRENGVVVPYVPSIVLGMLEEALAKGYVIDRTNEDGPLEDWDGWLFIIQPAGTVYIQTNWKGGAA